MMGGKQTLATGRPDRRRGTKSARHRPLALARKQGSKRNRARFGACLASEQVSVSISSKSL